MSERDFSGGGDSAAPDEQTRMAGHMDAAIVEPPPPRGTDQIEHEPPSSSEDKRPSQGPLEAVSMKSPPGALKIPPVRRPTPKVILRTIPKHYSEELETYARPLTVKSDSQRIWPLILVAIISVAAIIVGLWVALS